MAIWLVSPPGSSSLQSRLMF